MIALLKLISLVIWMVMVICLVFRPGTRVIGRRVSKVSRNQSRRLGQGRRRIYRLKPGNSALVDSGGVPGGIGSICLV